MTLSSSDIRTALWVVEEFGRRRRIIGQPIPAAVTDLRTHLLVMSAHGPNPVVQQPNWTPEQIDTHKAAELLNITPRHVRRIAADLDGQHIAGRWIFNRDTVLDYAESRNQ